MPEVDRFAAHNPDITVIKVNVDTERALTTEWEVRTIPMMVYVPADGAPRAILGFTRAEDIEKKIRG
jgi:thioredoxin-like negative regulator of GroEL